MIMMHIKCKGCGKVSRLEEYEQTIDDKIELLFKIADELHYRQSILEKLK